MILRINGSESIIEGGMQEICIVLVPADHREGLVQRDIPIFISVVPQSGMCAHTLDLLLFLARLNFTIFEGDYNTSNVPAVIPVGVSQSCFQLVAIDDTIVESDEEFTLIVEAENLNDVISGNMTIVVSDNDGKGQFPS